MNPIDPLEAIPTPEEVKRELAEAVRRRELLRSLLRVAIRVANYPKPQAPTLAIRGDDQ